MNTMTKNDTHATIEDVEAEDHHVSQSSILYLLQEASKLALPAKVLDYAETDSAKVPNENPEPRHSLPGSLCPSQFPDKSGEGNSQPSFLGSFSFVHARADSSPWEVMSLINQQCERLLHSRQTDGREEDFTALSNGYPSKSVPVCPTNNRIRSEGSECQEKHACPPAVSLLADSEKRDHGSIVSDIGETIIVKEEVHVAQRTKTVPECTARSTQNVDDEAADAQVNLSDHNYSFLVSTRCRLLNHRQAERVESLCSEVEVEVSPCTESPPQSNQRPASGCQEDRRLPHRKSAEPAPSPSSMTEPGLTLAREGAFKPSFGFTLDCNNNIQPHSPSQTRSHTVHKHRGPGISSATLGLSLPERPLALDHKSLRDQAEGECSGTPKTKAQTQNQTQTQAKVQTAPQPDKQRSRTPRKQAHPSRSADPCDSNLQGVIFNMNTKLDDGTNQCRLLITSNYRYSLVRFICQRNGTGVYPQPCA